MIINSAFLDTRFEANTLHMQEHTRYTSQLTAVQDAVVLQINRSENQRTRGVIWRSRDLAWTCGHVCWSTTTWL